MEPPRLYHAHLQPALLQPSLGKDGCLEASIYHAGHHFILQQDGTGVRGKQMQTFAGTGFSSGLSSLVLVPKSGHTTQNMIYSPASG